MSKKLPLFLVFAIFVSSLLASCGQGGNTNPDSSGLPSITPSPVVTPESEVTLEEIGKSVIRVVELCSAKVSFRSKTYDIVAGSLGSGFFVDSRGYIVTAAHTALITNNAKKTSVEEACGSILFENLLYQIAADLGKDPAQFTNEDKQIISDRSQLVSRIDNQSLVFMPNGDKLSFDIKEFGEPLDTERLRGKDVSVIKVNLDNAP
ncbi:MAG: S1C family serine protease, partial [Sphaerospermopsis sp.]|nr:S1C family serine protease [Sphaerospermopsis sp.]